VHLRNKAKPLGGIRQYETNDYYEVCEIVYKELLKHYSGIDIIKIDVWPLTETSIEVQEYIKNKQSV
jgi:hypothetical protein